MNNLQKIRKSCGLTQKELAEKSGLPIRAIQNYEQGFRSINGAAAETACKIAQALNCAVLDLLEKD